MDYFSNYKNWTKVQITEKDIWFKLQKMKEDSNYRKWISFQITENRLEFKLQEINHGSNYRKLIMVKSQKMD